MEKIDKDTGKDTGKDMLIFLLLFLVVIEFFLLLLLQVPINKKQITKKEVTGVIEDTISLNKNLIALLQVKDEAIIAQQKVIEAYEDALLHGIAIDATFNKKEKIKHAKIKIKKPKVYAKPYKK